MQAHREVGHRMTPIDRSRSTERLRWRSLFHTTNLDRTTDTIDGTFDACGQPATEEPCWHEMVGRDLLMVALCERSDAHRPPMTTESPWVSII
jgi:hypothetical protein